MPRTLRLTIPGQIHPSLNETNRMHWAKRREVKQQWEADIFWITREAGWKAPPMERARVTVKYFFGNKQRHDPDNFAPKGIMDGLVKAGVLKDDNAGLIDLHLQLHPDGPRRTEIEVEEVGT